MEVLKAVFTWAPWLVSSDVVFTFGHAGPAGAGGLEHPRCEQQGLQSLTRGKMLLVLAPGEQAGAVVGK